MKFEVEVISDGRCIIPSIDGTAKIVADDILGGTLRGMSCQPAAVTKRAYPKGTRKRKAKAAPEEAAQA